LGINGKVIDVLPVSQPTVSKHQKKLGALTPTFKNHPLASSFVHPPPDRVQGMLLPVRWLFVASTLTTNN